MRTTRETTTWPITTDSSIEDIDNRAKEFPEDPEEDKKDRCLWMRKPRQFRLQEKSHCFIVCLSNERKPSRVRMSKYARPNKKMDEAKRHSKGLIPGDVILCTHPTCNLGAKNDSARGSWFYKKHTVTV